MNVLALSVRIMRCKQQKASLDNLSRKGYFGFYKVNHIIIRKDQKKKPTKTGQKNRQGSIEPGQQTHTKSCYKNSWDIAMGTTNGHHCDLVLTQDTALAASVAYECITICFVFASQVQDSNSQADAFNCQTLVSISISQLLGTDEKVYMALQYHSGNLCICIFITPIK